MDVVPYLSAVILIATIATLVLAIFSYAAFRLRNRRQPKLDRAPVFFHRYRLEEVGGDGARGGAAGDAAGGDDAA